MPSPGPRVVRSPGTGTTYFAVVRENKTFVQGTDYKLGGSLAAATYYYRVAAFALVPGGVGGEGIAGAAISRATAAGDINQIAWPGYVPNAYDYHVYRSTDNVTFHFLANTYWDFFVDDGSFTPDAAKVPQVFQTSLSSPVAYGATSVFVYDTNGFQTAGTAYIGGSDIFQYTGKTATSFTGCTNVSQNAAGTTVRMGPDMGPITVTLAPLGVINWTPVGLDPADGTNYSVTYDYYQRRIDRVVIDRWSVLAIVKGVPADYPAPAPMPPDVLELAQVSAEAQSTTLAIKNLTLYDRPLVSELRTLMARVEELYHNDVGQQVLNEIADRDATTMKAKLGLVADGFSNLDHADIFNPDFCGAHRPGRPRPHRVPEHLVPRAPGARGRDHGGAHAEADPAPPPVDPGT